MHIVHLSLVSRTYKIYHGLMRFLLLSVAFLPTVVFAESVCYSPSDCAAPEVCSSFFDNIFPGTCIIPGEGQVPLYEFTNVSTTSPSSESSSSVSSSSSSTPPTLPKPSVAGVQILTAPPESSSSESSSSPSVEVSEEEKPTAEGNFFTKAFNGFVTDIKNAFCFFFCKKE